MTDEEYLETMNEEQIKVLALRRGLTIVTAPSHHKNPGIRVTGIPVYGTQKWVELANNRLWRIQKGFQEPQNGAKSV